MPYSEDKPKCDPRLHKTRYEMLNETEAATDQYDQKGEADGEQLFKNNTLSKC
jgi:hypothetical protein